MLRSYQVVIDSMFHVINHLKVVANLPSFGENFGDFNDVAFAVIEYRNNGMRRFLGKFFKQVGMRTAKDNIAVPLGPLLPLHESDRSLVPIGVGAEDKNLSF